MIQGPTGVSIVLEEAIKANTAAVVRQNELLEAMLKGAKAPATAAASTGKTETAPETGKAATTAPKGGKGSKAPKAPSEDDIRTAFGAYMGVKDKEQREERKGHVAAMIAHFEVERVTAIPEDKRADALAYLKQLEAGETPDYAQGEEDENEDEGALL
jgi:hypothetical protein